MKRSKTSAAKTKRPNQMTKEELIATLLKKKQCNAKALSIVELMTENDVDSQWLLDSLQFISQSHYQDAVDERAIIKLCGYPLCKNPLGNIPKQRYSISTQSNKVYDISERKKFCGNACYRSSTFLKEQIMTSPLWLRDIDKVPEYKLLDGGKLRGGFGDEIDVGPVRVPLEEALVGLDISKETEDLSQGDCNIKEPSGESRESSLDTSRNNDLEESSAPQKSEHDSPINEKKILAGTPMDLSQDDKLACTSKSLETLNEPKEKLLKIDKPEETIKPCENSSHVVPCSVNNVSEKPSCTDVMQTRAELVESNIRKEDTVSKNTACDLSRPKSSEVLTTTTPENCFEKSSLDETENSKEMKERDNHKAKVRKEKRPSRHAQVSPVTIPGISEIVEERLKEWFTVDSLCFLYGEQRVREMLGHLGGDLEQNFKPLNSATWDPEKHERFVNMCKRLDLRDLVDKSYDEKVINEEKNVVKKPLPDFNILKKEADEMDLRVRAFYKGQLELEPKKVTFSEDTKEAAEETELPVIPLVHQHEQRALRRRLVLDALNRVLPDLLRTIGVPTSQVNSVLRGLVGTFALNASNCTFNPRQWTLMAIAIIKLLSLREVRLQHALASEASQKYLTLIQMSYNLSPTFLDLLIDRLVSSTPLKTTDIS